MRRVKGTQCTAFFVGIALSVVLSLEGQTGAKHPPQDVPPLEPPAGPASRTIHREGSTDTQVLNRALDLIQKNDFSGAAKLLRPAVASSPSDGRLHHYYGYALLRTEQVPAAKREFETAVKLNPENFYAEYFLGFIAYSQGDFSQAAHHFERLIADGHSVYDTYQRLSLAYMHSGNLTKAMGPLQTLIQKSPYDGSLHFQLAKILEKMGRRSEAQEEFESAERLNRADRDSIRELHELSQALEAGRNDRAVELRNQMIGHFEGKAELLTSLGILLADKELYNEAAQPLQMAAQLLPKSYEAQFNLGLNLLKQGGAAEAERYLQVAVALRPDSFQANSTLAVLYINEEHFQEAIERLLVARRAAPEDVNISVLLGQQYLRAGQAGKAIPVLAEAVRLRSDNPDIWYLMTQAYEKDSRYEDALRTAQKSAGLFPSNARSHLEVGFELVNMGHYEEAKPYAQKALQIDSSFVPAYNLLGDIESRSGEYDSALHFYQSAGRLAPTNLDARVGIAKSLILLKRYAEALAELQDALKTFPDSPDLYFHLTQVYTRLGERDQAARADATFRRLRPGDAPAPR